MQDLPIKRDLSDDSYREGETVVGGVFVSIWRTPTEVIITDGHDPTKILMIASKEFHDTAFIE